MLNTYHGGHHRVYNLCSEKSYDPQRFTDGEVVAYPFDDHEVPALDLLFSFIRCALQSRPMNVVRVQLLVSCCPALCLHCSADAWCSQPAASTCVWQPAARAWVATGGPTPTAVRSWRPPGRRPESAALAVHGREVLAHQRQRAGAPPRPRRAVVSGPRVRRRQL